MRIAGKIVISNSGTQVFKKHIDDRDVPGINKDGWKQTPGKIMFGNGLTWTATLLCPGYDENVFTTFGVSMDSFQDNIWSEPTSSRRERSQPYH